MLVFSIDKMSVHPFKGKECATVFNPHLQLLELSFLLGLLLLPPLLLLLLLQLPGQLQVRNRTP